MTDVVLFHHAQGRTPGVLALADAWRAAGHRVAVPDLFDGRTFDDLVLGMQHVQELGFAEIVERGEAAAADRPAAAVYVGISLGAIPAQKLAQARPGALGAVLIGGAVPAVYFGGWPAGLPAQVHLMADDELGDVEEARALAADVDAELYVYPGDRHLFVDSSLPAHEPAAAALVGQRVLQFLDRVGRGAAAG